MTDDYTIQNLLRESGLYWSEETEMVAKQIMQLDMEGKINIARITLGDLKSLTGLVARMKLLSENSGISPTEAKSIVLEGPDLPPAVS